MLLTRQNKMFEHKHNNNNNKYTAFKWTESKGNMCLFFALQMYLGIIKTSMYQFPLLEPFQCSLYPVCISSPPLTQQHRVGEKKLIKKCFFFIEVIFIQLDVLKCLDSYWFSNCSPKQKCNYSDFYFVCILQCCFFPLCIRFLQPGSTQHRSIVFFSSHSCFHSVLWNLRNYHIVRPTAMLNQHTLDKSQYWDVPRRNMYICRMR